MSVVDGWIQDRSKLTFYKSNDGGDIYMWNVEMQR